MPPRRHHAIAAAAVLAVASSGVAGTIIPAKIVFAPADQVSLGQLVRAVASVEIGARVPSPAQPPLNNLPRFIAGTGDARFGPVVATPDRLLLLTAAGDSVRLTIQGSRPYFVMASPIDGDLAVFENTAKGLQVSRRNADTGAARWSSNLGTIWLDSFVGETTSKQVGTSYTSTTSIYSAPIRVSFTADGAKLALIGLRGVETAGFGSYFGSLAIIDWTTGGGPIEPWVFHREVPDGRAFLVQLGEKGGPPTKKRLQEETASFKVFDPRTGTFTASGILAAGDLIADDGSDKTPPFGCDRRTGLWHLDFATLAVGTELWLVGRELKGKLIREAWTRFDATGKRLGRIEPAPQTALDFVIRNQGSSPWPMVFARIGRQAPGLTVEGLLHLTGDGTVTSLPVPRRTPGEKVSFDGPAWFHDGVSIYSVEEDGIFIAKLGEPSLTRLAGPPPGETFTEAPVGHAGYVVVAGKSRHHVLRLADGAAAGPADSPVAAELHAVALDLDRERNDLPTDGLPPTFKYYLEGVSRSYVRGAVEAHGRLEALRLWGRRGEPDVMLVPGQLKDAQAILVGIELPANRVAFWVPALNVRNAQNHEIPGENPVPYGVTFKDENTVLLTVLETFDRGRVYEVRRPATRTQEQATSATP